MARQRADAEEIGEKPAPRHPLLRLLLADVVLQNGSRFLRQNASRRLLTDRSPVAPEKLPLPKRLASLAAMRVATGSWPGAAIIGAGLLAHSLYKRGKARRNAPSSGADT